MPQAFAPLSNVAVAVRKLVDSVAMAFALVVAALIGFAIRPATARHVLVELQLSLDRLEDGAHELHILPDAFLPLRLGSGDGVIHVLLRLGPAPAVVFDGKGVAANARHLEPPRLLFLCQLHGAPFPHDTLLDLQHEAPGALDLLEIFVEGQEPPGIGRVAIFLLFSPCNLQHHNLISLMFFDFRGDLGNVDDRLTCRKFESRLLVIRVRIIQVQPRSWRISVFRGSRCTTVPRIWSREPHVARHPMASAPLSRPAMWPGAATQQLWRLEAAGGPALLWISHLARSPAVLVLRSSWP